MSTDVAVLAKLIHLPVAPKAAVWQALDQSRGDEGWGSSDWTLVAVLTFDSDGINLLRQSTPVGADTPLANPKFRNTLAPELRNLLATVLADPNPSWRSGETFFRSPLLAGHFAIVPTADQVVLCLFTT